MKILLAAAILAPAILALASQAPPPTKPMPRVNCIAQATTKDGAQEAKVTMLATGEIVIRIPAKSANNWGGEFSYRCIGW